MESLEASDQKPYPGLWQAVGICGLYLLAVFVLVVPMIGVGMAFDVRLEENPATMALVSLGATIWVLGLYRNRTGIAQDTISGPLGIPLRTIFPIAAVVIGLLMAEIPLLLWLINHFPVLDHVSDYGFEKSQVGAFVLLVLVAPLTEELLFRGVFLRGFVARYGASRALLLSSTLFALAHFYPIKFLSTFAIGLLLGWLYLKFGTIWPGVMAHAMNNAVGFWAMTQGDPAKPFANTPADPQLFLLVPAGAALAAAGWWSLRRSVGTPQ